MSNQIRAEDETLYRRWRPAMGWMYMIVCIFDFIIFPLLWSLLQMKANGEITHQWEPLTIHGAGIFHLAMGAVLGIAAYGRTQEKISGLVNGITLLGQNIEPAQRVPTPVQAHRQEVVEEPEEESTNEVILVKRKSFAENSKKIPV